MKAYILTEKDFDLLLSEIDRNPEHGWNGGSSAVISEEERRVYNEAHRFYNYIIHKWIDKVKETK